MDYWAVSGNNTYLIEVKEAWIRHKKDNSFTFFHLLHKRLSHAIEQIDSISNRRDLNYSKRMFGLGLVIAPIFYRIPCKDEPLKLKFSSENIEKLSKQAMSSGSNIFYFWKVPVNYLCEESAYDDKKENIIGLAIIGRYKKLSKE